MITKYFIVIYILTIVITRFWLHFFPKHGPTILGFRPHHYAYGLAIIVISFLIFKSILLPIGLGLVVDEIPLFFIFGGWNWPDNHWKEYFSWQCVMGIVLISIVCYFAINFIFPLLNSTSLKN